MDPAYLRPFERRVIAMRHEGVSVAEIARRFRRSPEHVQRVLQWTTIPRNGSPRRITPPAIERRVVAMRVAGEPYEQIAERLRRSPESIRQIEGLTYFLRGVTQTVFDRGRELLQQNAAEARRRLNETRARSENYRKEATNG